ncbi:protein rolling stone-like [Cydia pomonella]|uniref:protein rolling stone-like n=1 Tax=Cydia pomonella TaxID=82600 RepID=UPI002ADDBABE|nr:protein rolling stone-like [Cydia pomonella]
MFLRKIRCSDLWVSSHDKSSDFYLCAWQRGASPWPLLWVRAALAAAGAAVLAWSLAGGGGASPRWPIYLTNWGLLLLEGAALAGLLVSCRAVCRRPPEESTTAWMSLYWVLFNVAQTVALAITVLYWLLLYDPETTVYPTAEALGRDVATHALNSALTLAELLAARTPARALHAWQPLLLATAYAAFSAVYYAAGGTNIFGESFIYPVLDWSTPAAAGAVAGASLAGALVLHVLVCVLARARSAAATALMRPGDRDLDSATRLP